MKPQINLKESNTSVRSTRARKQGHVELDPIPDFQTFVDELFDDN